MKIKIRDVAGFQELLIRKGYTQRGLGREVGIAESYATQIASGERNPGPGVAKRICAALETDFDDIFQIEHACKNTEQEAI